MRSLIAFGLIILVLALNSGATAPVQLSGDSGKAILANVASALNRTTSSPENQTSNASAGDLWSWGTLPTGYALDKSGKLVKISSSEEWLPSI